MAPRPYCEKSSLPADSNDSVSSIPTQVLPESPSPSTASGATTPSPTPQEVIPTESFVDTVYAREGNGRLAGSTAPCYPTPGDVMPYDHSLPDFIRQITNQPNLENLQTLSLRVISTLISLHRMAAYLPNLRELDLEGSVLNSLRDIGCSLKNLQILKVGRCQLESLDGTFGLSSLRELHAQKNLINDVSPCSNLPHIRHVDVSGNRIRNISYVGFLSVCSKLRSIVFTGNPATEVAGYRKHVRRMLPQIETLDGIPLLNEANAEESNDSDLVEHVGEGSDSGSTELPDFMSVSPSDSLNNFLESEEDAFLLDKRNKQAKNVANQDQFETAEYDGYKYGLQDDFQNANWHQDAAIKGLLEQSKIIEHRNVRQKCTSIQKLDKDIENRSKKSNLLLNSAFGSEMTPERMGVPSTSGTRETGRPGNRDSLSDFQGHEMKARERSSGAIRKRSAASLSTRDEDAARAGGESILTKGLPICGNLTAALRNRRKLQSAFGEKEMSPLKNAGALDEEERKCLRVQINGSGDYADLDSLVENEDDFIAKDVLESSRKWREAFRRYRSNNRGSWEEDDKQEDEE